MKPTNNTFDYLIIGLGIAGTLLSYKALKRKKTFKLLDNDFNQSASLISSGVINPVTGRRLVKSWMIETLIEKAEEDYKGISKLLNKNIIKFAQITRLIKNVEEENIWMSRIQNDSLSYLTDTIESKSYQKFFKEFKSVGKISPALVVDIELLLKEWKQFLLSKNSYINTKLLKEDLIFRDGGIEYDSMFFKHLIFADGQSGLSKEYFNFLNYENAKGEVIYIKSDDFNGKEMIKAGTNIIPLKEHLYWIGSNYEWDPKDDKPSVINKETILSKLNKSVKFEYTIIDHKAAIRACTKDRKPYIGIHPDYPQLVIFNGLGTKGMSLAPYFSTHLFEYLEQGTSLLAEVDIKRFLP